MLMERNYFTFTHFRKHFYSPKTYGLGQLIGTYEDIGFVSIYAGRDNDTIEVSIGFIPIRMDILEESVCEIHDRGETPYGSDELIKKWINKYIQGTAEAFTIPLGEIFHIIWEIAESSSKDSVAYIESSYPAASDSGVETNTVIIEFDGNI